MWLRRRAHCEINNIVERRSLAFGLAGNKVCAFIVYQPLEQIDVQTACQKLTDVTSLESECKKLILQELRMQLGNLGIRPWLGSRCL
jgi:hypothetical protein